jgi:hypothetical protein
MFDRRLPTNPEAFTVVDCGTYSGSCLNDGGMLSTS